MKLTKKQKYLFAGGILLILILKKAVDKFKLFDKFYRVTSPYGERTHPVTGAKSFHNGIDFATPTGTPLKSAFNGIANTKYDSLNGNQVTITNPRYRVIYDHLSQVNVKPGQMIKKGDIIGLSGNTGRSTGPHLHLSLYDLKLKTYINPAPYIINTLST